MCGCSFQREIPISKCTKAQILELNALSTRNKISINITHSKKNNQSLELTRNLTTLRINTVPALLVTKNSRTFRDPRSIPWPCRKPAMLKYRDKQQLPTIYIYICIYIYVCACVFTTVTFWEEIAKKLFKHRRVQTRIIWRLHLHHCWANSRTVHLDFQDQTYIKDFPD